MNDRNHWVVIADGSAAAIYSADPRLEALESVAQFSHSGSRAPDAQHSVHEHELVAFAREIAERLRHGLDDHAYESLVIAASPGFLGHLRSVLDARVAKAVVGSVAHDYTHLQVQELTPLLRKNLPIFEH